MEKRKKISKGKVFKGPGKIKGISPQQRMWGK
jgi:hypothetical protein